MISAETTLKIEASLAALPLPQRERLALYGARLLLTEMKSRLALATHELAHFESKYGLPLAHLNEAGLPEEANWETHEDYVEWSGWQATHEETSQIVETLQAILEAGDAFTSAS